MYKLLIVDCVVGVLDVETEILCSILTLTTSWNCNTVFPSFNSSTRLVINSQLLSLPTSGILNKFMLDLQHFLSVLLRKYSYYYHLG